VYPPTLAIDGACLLQPLVHVNGFRLAPDEAARAVFIMEAVGTGSFEWRGVDVTYELNGDTYHEIITQGQRGTVITKGDEFPDPTPDEKRCARENGSRLLP